MIKPRLFSFLRVLRPIGLSLLCQGFGLDTFDFLVVMRTFFAHCLFIFFKVPLLSSGPIIGLSRGEGIPFLCATLAWDDGRGKGFLDSLRSLGMTIRARESLPRLSLPRVKSRGSE